MVGTPYGPLSRGTLYQCCGSRQAHWTIRTHHSPLDPLWQTQGRQTRLHLPDCLADLDHFVVTRSPDVHALLTRVLALEDLADVQASQTQRLSPSKSATLRELRLGRMGGRSLPSWSIRVLVTSAFFVASLSTPLTTYHDSAGLHLSPWLAHPFCSTLLSFSSLSHGFFWLAVPSVSWLPWLILALSPLAAAWCFTTLGKGPS